MTEVTANMASVRLPASMSGRGSPASNMSDRGRVSSVGPRATSAVCAQDSSCLASGCPKRFSRETGGEAPLAALQGLVSGVPKSIPDALAGMSTSKVTGPLMS